MKRYVKSGITPNFISKIQKEIDDATLQYLKTGRFYDDSINIYDYISQEEIEYWQQYAKEHPEEYEDIDELEDNSLVEDEYIDEYTVRVNEIDSHCIRIEVSTELGDAVEYLEDVLNPIVQKYDKESYFEPDTYGIISAYIRK